jgi:hypothetical protein
LESEIKTRLYQPGDEDEILTLLQPVFTNYNKCKLSSDYWKWKYIDTPLGSIICVATIDGKIVGVIHSVLLNIKISNKIILGSMGGDATTHTDYRGLGVYTKLVNFIDKARDERVIFRYSTSINPIIIKTKRDQPRISFPKEISYMIRIHDIDLHLKNRPRKNRVVIGLGIRVFKFVNRILRFFSSVPNSKNDFVIEETNKFDSSVEVFWNNIKDGYNFILVKDQQYLNWRYCDRRGGDFFVFKAGTGGDLLGFVVVQLDQKDGYSEGLIVDLLALPERLDVAYALMRRVCEFIDDRGVNAVYYECVDGHPYQSISTKNEFLDSRLGPYVRCVMGDEDYQIINGSPPKMVYFNYGDLF